MSTTTPEPAPDSPTLGTFPKPVLELCARLEDAGIGAYLQGEALLDAWLGERSGRVPTRAVVCTADAAHILRALPAAVVTAESAKRLTQATLAGPVDLIPVGERDIESALGAFGLTPLAVGFRPSNARWHAPGDSLEALARRELDLLPARPNPFLDAPRRYWIAAQLIAEYDLEPTPAFVEAAREALPEVVTRLPEGAPARRVLERILGSSRPARALRFLRETGASLAVLPGLDAGAEPHIEALGKIASLRWAAFLHGSSTARALARLRMPTGLARRISRVQEAHPLDRTIEGARDPQIRRAMGRLTAEELDGLIVWRRLELADQPSSQDGDRFRDRLSKIESGLARLRSQASESQSVRALALGGADVMQLLGSGPGPHVGRALAHLARIVAEDPGRNESAALTAELLAWQALDSKTDAKTDAKPAD
jgi:tRNA nucleotidyltransferase (CCA-adding enzyme)